MSLSTNDMESRTPDSGFLFPASIVCAGGGGFLISYATPFWIVFEVVALTFLAWSLFRFDRARCELSYWWGRQDEDDWWRAHRIALKKAEVYARKTEGAA